MVLAAELRDYRLGLVSPLVTAHGVVDHRDGVLFSISDGTNVGWGEAAPMPGWSRESLDDTKTVLVSIAPRLAEMDSIDDPRFGTLLTELEARPHARAAVAGAALDLLARSHKVSIASLLEVSRGLGSTSAVSPQAEPEAPHSLLVDRLVSQREPDAPRSLLVDGLVSQREPEAPRSVLVDGSVSQGQPDAPRSVLVEGLVSQGQPDVPRSVLVEGLVSQREQDAPRSVLAEGLASQGQPDAPRSVLVDGSVSQGQPDAPRSVLVSGLVSDDQPEAVANAVAELALQGLSAVKLKVAAGDPRADLARVAAARDAMGDEIELRLDANGGWDVDTAIVTLCSMARYNVAFCEEPTAGIGGIAAVGAASAIPVAVDESAATLSDVAAALRTGMISVVVIKPQALGGPDLALAAVALIEESGADAVVTTMIDSAVGVAHAAHVAAAALPEQAHGLATSALLANDTAPLLKVEAGRLHLPQTPGLGVSPTR